MGSRSLNLYVGLTNNLRKRVWQHKKGEAKGFTQRYRIDRLLYFEEFVYFDRAEYRETELKKWRREKKIELIKAMNPTLLDLAERWYDDLPLEMQIPRRFAPRNDKSKVDDKKSCTEMQITRRSAPRNDNSKSSGKSKTRLAQ